MEGLKNILASAEREIDLRAFALEAPREIPPWFEPDNLAAEPVWPKCFDERGIPRQPTPLERAQMDAWNAWERERLKSRVFQWPWAYARGVLAARPKPEA